jgi:hypothetical protein
VPDVPATLMLLLEGTRVYGRCSGRSAFVLDGFTLRQALDAVRAEGARGVKHAVAYVDQSARPRFQAELAKLPDESRAPTSSRQTDCSAFRRDDRARSDESAAGLVRAEIELARAREALADRRELARAAGALALAARGGVLVAAARGRRARRAIDRKLPTPGRS